MAKQHKCDGVSNTRKNNNMGSYVLWKYTDASTKSFDVVITKCLEVWCLVIQDNTHVGHNN